MFNWLTNTKKPWFGVNKFWGWYPISWQGFAVLLLMFTLILGVMFYANYNSHSVSDMLITAFPLISLIISATMHVTFLTGKKPEFGKASQTSKSYSPDNPQAYLFLALLALPIAAYYVAFNGYFGSLVFLLVFLLQLKLYFKLNKIDKNK